MSVILELSIDSEDFKLGQALKGSPEMHLELERVVPSGGMMMPFVWATGGDHEAFEKMVRADPTVQAVRVLDRLGESRLYRIEWADVPVGLLVAIARTDATILEAHGNQNWTFRLRFPDHDTLSAFHIYVTDHEIPINVERTYTLTEETEFGYRFGLTQEQREALVLALKRGYFRTPSEVHLDELAAELNISQQALSKRIRHGNEKILNKTLLSATATPS